MARLNRKSATVKNIATTPISTTGNRVVNQQGGIGWERTPKSELFLAAVTSLNEVSSPVCEDESYSAMSSMSAWVIDLLLLPICWRSPCVVIHTFGVASSVFMMYDGYIT